MSTDSQGWCAIFSAAELSIGTTCLALATYRPLLRLVRRRPGSSANDIVKRDGGASGDSSESAKSGSSYEQHDLKAVTSLTFDEEKQMKEEIIVKHEGTWFSDASHLGKIPSVSENGTWFREGSEFGKDESVG